MEQANTDTVTCPVCGTHSVRKIGKPRVNADFPRLKENDYFIVQCRNCTFYFVAPAIDLSNEEWRALYKDDYFGESVKTPWQVSLNARELELRSQLILSHLSIPKGQFLDMGCGEGYMLQKSADKGFEAFGLDLANNIHPDFAGKFKFHEGSLEEANFEQERFSVIYMDSVLEHVKQPFATLSELKRILKPGGLMLFIVPNEDSLMNAMVKWAYRLSFRSRNYGKIKPFVTPYHINGFNKNSFRRLFELQGLTVVSVRGFGGDYMFWKAYRPFSKRWVVNLALYPFGLLSALLGRQVQLMALVQKG
jgi:SAM-dependent methyltransferase